MAVKKIRAYHQTAFSVITQSDVGKKLSSETDSAFPDCRDEITA